MRRSSNRLSISFGSLGTSSPETVTGPREDTAAKPDLNTDELQFAGVLLRGVEQLAATPIVLFATLSGAGRLPAAVRRVAEAMREVRRCKVALVQLSSSGDPTNDPTKLDLPELDHLRNWNVAGSATAAEFRWTGASAQSAGVVPAVEVMELFEKLKRNFDMICVDAGDVFASPNAIATAPRCSGVVLMVERDVTAARDVERGQRLLLQAGARVLGFAFTELG